jgi:hypothetical protein
MGPITRRLNMSLLGANMSPGTDAPPTTQLMWLKEKKVDLTLGIMVNPGHNLHQGSS